MLRGATAQETTICIPITVNASNPTSSQNWLMVQIRLTEGIEYKSLILSIYSTLLTFKKIKETRLVNLHSAR
jgi:hypothetical protein